MPLTTRKHRSTLPLVVALACFGGGCSGPETPGPAGSPTLALEPYTLDAEDGTRVDCERGHIVVPENRATPGSRDLTLRFIRFRSTSAKPGSPIIYLAGGPGGSGIAAARGERLPLFLALREVADVIALDQRGTGSSNDIPPCSGPEYPLDRPATRGEFIPFARAAAAACVDFWRERGIDLAGYDTVESAADLDDLRAALGASKISLWAISYGTHLALAALQHMPRRIDRLVLASAEGLDQTVKLPAATDRYFGRVQQAIDLDPAAREAYPDLAGLMRRVHARLAAKPAVTTFTAEDGQSVTMTIGDFEVQLLIAAAIADPEDIRLLPAAYAAMDAGDFSAVARQIHALGGRPLEFRGMPEAMDTASGISPVRLELVLDQARTAILGDALNFPMPHLAGAFGVPDLGDEFRTQRRTDAPALFLTGTLDGRTYPEEHAAIIKSFSRATQVIVENAGHNLFMVSPRVTDVIVEFMQGRPVSARRIAIDPPRFAY